MSRARCSSGNSNCGYRVVNGAMKTRVGASHDDFLAGGVSLLDGCEPPLEGPSTATFADQSAEPLPINLVVMREGSRMDRFAVEDTVFHPSQSTSVSFRAVRQPGIPHKLSVTERHTGDGFLSDLTFVQDEDGQNPNLSHGCFR